MPADHVGVLVSGVLMLLGGLLGLLVLVTNTLPRLGAELWLFFLLLHLTVTGAALPIVRYLNVRFTPVNADPPPGGVLVRESVWVGLFAVILAWLQLMRVLSVPIAFFVALIFVVLEIFLRTRESG